MAVEIKDDTKDSFTKSVGFATYSNSRATVLSYVSIFESFWKQSELSKETKRVRGTSERLCAYCSSMQLKNPIQPILGLTDFLMKNKPEDKKQYQNIIKIINRNAKKLIQLTSDILDVTKIETNNLHLQKELFNLNDLISDIVEDYNNQFQENENIKLEYRCSF